MSSSESDTYNWLEWKPKLFKMPFCKQLIGTSSLSRPLASDENNNSFLCCIDKTFSAYRLRLRKQMAWLQNLTGQAEKFLNKIDQKAANVLNETNLKSKQSFQLQEDINVSDPGTIYIQEHVTTPKEEYMQAQTPSDDTFTLKETEILEKSSDEEFIDRTIEITAESSDQNTNNVSEIMLSAKTEHHFDETKKASSTSSKSEGALYSSAEVIQKYIEGMSKLEFENEDLSKQLLNIQHLYSEIRNENAILKTNLERANAMVSVAESEMEHYKARAHRILQEKEKLISLKTDVEIQAYPEENIYINYNEELKNELKFQLDKNKEFKEKIASLTSELVSLQQQYVVMQNTLQQSYQKTENDLLNERKTLLSVDEELKTKSQELNQVRQELLQKNHELISKAHEMDQLRNQLKEHSSIAYNEELEYRIQNLTQTLMMKQNKLETITSERNAFRIQLEKLENEYHRNLLVTRTPQQKVVHINDTDDVKLQIPQLMRVSPLDAGVTRRVKHAYSSLDSLSIRTGVFLRRYPGIRVFVFCYMVLLHFWVLIILLSHAPNIK